MKIDFQLKIVINVGGGPSEPFWPQVSLMPLLFGNKKAKQRRPLSQYFPSAPCSIAQWRLLESLRHSSIFGKGGWKMFLVMVNTTHKTTHKGHSIKIRQESKVCLCYHRMNKQLVIAQNYWRNLSRTKLKQKRCIKLVVIKVRTLKLWMLLYKWKFRKNTVNKKSKKVNLNQECSNLCHWGLNIDMSTAWSGRFRVSAFKHSTINVSFWGFNCV